MRLGQPQVVGEMVAGIVLGPSLFGLLMPGLSASIFPPDSLPNLNLVAQIGLVLFMFLVGLELDPEHFRGKGRAAAAISATSILAPFILGVLLALLLFPRLSSPAVGFTRFALFMGAAMSVTAFPVLARILTEQNLVRTRLGAMALVAGAVDDVSAWCILAFITAIARTSGAGAAPALATAAFSLLYILFMLLVARPLLAKIALYAINRGEVTHNVLAAVLLLVLVSAWTTERIGIHALFGAFLLGAVMPRDPRFVRQLADRLEHFTLVFLLPAFFAYTGLRTRIGLLNQPHLWAWAALILAVAVAGKFGGGIVASRVTGMSWREAAGVGVLMNTRGLMELVILTIGLDLGIITPTVFAMMVIMAIATTLMTTPLLHLIYPPAQRRREIVAAEAAAAAYPIVIPVSLPRSGDALLRVAAALTAKDGDKRKIYPLYLARARDTESGAQQTTDERAANALAPLLGAAASLEVNVSPITLVSRDIAGDICEVAATKEARLVLMGWHKPIVGRAVLAGTVREVMDRSATAVAVLVDRGLGSIRRVFVPFLGEPSDRTALELANRLHDGIGTEVVILHVVGPERAAVGPTASQLGAGEQVQLAFGEGDKPRVIMKVVPHTDPVAAVIEESKAGYDLAIIGVSAKWQLEPAAFGLRQERIVQECPSPLLIVHAPDPSRA